MKFKALTLATIALVISCVAPEVKALSETPQVEALSPERGTVVFIAQSEENPAQGVEVRIDGESKGFTEKDGKLKVEWLLFGDHFWEAIYGGKEVSRGEFEIEKIVGMEILDYWFEKEGKRGTEVYLADEATFTTAVKNTGTAPIDQLVMVWGTKVKEPKVEVIRPRVPPFLVKRLYQVFIVPRIEEKVDAERKLEPTESIELLSPDGKRKIVKSGETLEEITPIMPGETMVYAVKKTMAEWAREEMEFVFERGVAGVEFGGVETTIDEENAILYIVVKKCSMGPIKVKGLEMEIDVVGPAENILEIFINGKLVDSFSMEIEITKAIKKGDRE